MQEIPGKIKKLLVVMLVGGWTLLVFAFLQIPDGQFYIYFLNIRQGDSIFIKTPENHQILIDGGPKNYVIEELAEVMPFFDKTIDLVVLSHPHADHVDGLVEVVKRYEVENILLTGASYSNLAYDELLREVDKQGIPVWIAESGTDFRFGEVFMDILYPFETVVGQKFDNVNNSSVAVRVEYENTRILLTGDLEVEAEAELVAHGVDIEADIFKAGHHGSRSSSTLGFLERVSPEIVVIQSGEGNSYEHPHGESLENFEKVGVKRVYRNDLEGRVELVY